MRQPQINVPQVSRDDVLRVVRREFPQEHDAALAILDHYPAADDPRPTSEHGRARVQLAAIKLSRGDLETLCFQIARAIEDFRDVLMIAESPSWHWSTPRSEMDALEKKDLADYAAWLAMD